MNLEQKNKSPIPFIRTWKIPASICRFGGSPKFEPIQYDMNNSETKKHIENGDFDSVGVVTLTTDPKILCFRWPTQTCSS